MHKPCKSVAYCRTPNDDSAITDELVFIAHPQPKYKTKVKTAAGAPRRHVSFVVVDQSITIPWSSNDNFALVFSPQLCPHQQDDKCGIHEKSSACEVGNYPLLNSWIKDWLNGWIAFLQFFIIIDLSWWRLLLVAWERHDPRYNILSWYHANRFLGCD